MSRSDGARRGRRAAAREGSERSYRLGCLATMAGRNPAVRSRLRGGPANHGRAPSCEHRRRRPARLPGGASLRCHVESGEAARGADRDRRCTRRATGRGRWDDADGKHTRRAHDAQCRGRRRRADVRGALEHARSREDRRRRACSGRGRGRARGDDRCAPPRGSSPRAAGHLCGCIRVAGRDDAGLRSRRGPARRRHVHLVAAGSSARRRRTSRIARRRAARRLGGISRAHLRDRLAVPRTTGADAMERNCGRVRPGRDRRRPPPAGSRRPRRRPRSRTVARPLGPRARTHGGNRASRRLEPSSRRPPHHRGRTRDRHHP
ncbi:MAG: hypothetical protein QOH28_460 [Actinomycetota bacterium]|nr:hypothetical protein [Actinomycetota bacterium]